MRSIFGIAPLVIGSLLGCLAAPQAQAATPLAAAFAQAWQRQPAALAAGERARAVNAQAEAANRWTPAPANLELGLRSDRFNRNQGASEVDVGLAVPLWLPGERSGAQALAAAAEGALAGRQAALRLQLAHDPEALQPIRNALTDDADALTALLADTVQARVTELLPASRSRSFVEKSSRSPSADGPGKS